MEPPQLCHPSSTFNAKSQNCCAGWRPCCPAQQPSKELLQLQVIPKPHSLISTRSTVCRLEAVLYSLAAVSKELLQLRQPCTRELQAACALASAACATAKT